MSAYTPGPWDYHTADGAATPHIAIYAPDEEGNEIDRIADVYGAPLNEANAELIAAAPDLLAALESAEQCICDLLERTEFARENATGHDVPAIRAAIAKAKGEEE